MALRYYKLFDILQRRGIKKGELTEKANLSWPTMSKLSKGQSVNSEIIDRICKALDCQPGDIMEYVDSTKLEVALEISQHIAKINHDPVYQRECRKNQAQEIRNMFSETQKSPDSE